MSCGMLGSKWLVNGVFHLAINGVYWGYNLLTNHLLSSWDIQVLFVDGNQKSGGAGRARAGKHPVEGGW